MIKVYKDLNIAGKLTPFRVLVYREDDSTDRDYIDLKRMNLIGEELRMFIRRYLVIYINQDTKRMKYAALTKIEQLLAIEPPKKFEYNIKAIILI